MRGEARRGARDQRPDDQDRGFPEDRGGRAETSGIRAEISDAARLYATDRAVAVAILERIYAVGRPPDPALDGRYRGTLLTTTTFPWLDRAVRALTQRWLPWKGKYFVPSERRGDNVFGNEGLWLARLLFPRYRHIRPDGPGRSRALRFETFPGPSLDRADRTALQLDYDLAENPRFAVRRIRDELVEVAPGVYLGTAYLRWRGRWRPLAWFLLEAEAAKA